MTINRDFIPVLGIAALLMVACFAPTSWADDNGDQPALHVANGQVFGTATEANAYLDSQRPQLVKQIADRAIAGGYAATVVFDNQPINQGIHVGNPEHIAAFERQDRIDSDWQANAARDADETIRVSQEFIAHSRSIFNGQTDDRSDPSVKQAAIISTAQQAQFEAGVKAQAEAQAKRILQDAKPIEYPKPRVLVAYEEKKEK